MRLVRHTGFALCFCLGLAAHCQDARAADSPPLPDRNPQRSGGTPASHLPGAAKTVPWSAEEIAAAKEECHTLLDSAAIEYEALPPIKEGLCGAPAPILVKSVGSDPKVSIDPPATMRCPLAKALLGWLGETAQPKAKAELGSTVVGLRNATSYACRNRYGGANTPISEHALANALDISEFKLASGISVTVLKAWPVAVPPPPSAASGDDTKETGAKDDGAKKNPEPKDAERAKLTPADRVEATPASATKTTESVVKKSAAKEKQTAPAAMPTAPIATEPKEPATKFVRAMHAGACKTFGTVLGPAANEAHRDHFHFDMKQRRKGFCE